MLGFFFFFLISNLDEKQCDWQDKFKHVLFVYTINNIFVLMNRLECGHG